MGLAGDIRKKIDRKHKELGELKTRRGQIQASLRETDTLIREVNAALAAYEEVLKLTPEDSEEDSGERTMRVGSMVALAREALRRHGKPMHVGKLLEALGKQDTHEQKVSLSSSMAAYVRKGQVFTRPEPNVFGLLEWQQTTPITAVESPTEKDVAEVLEKVR